MLIVESKAAMEETAPNINTLTDREMSILRKVGQGLTTPQIATELGLSPETVKWYRKQLLAKFSASTSAEMTRKAVELHII